jgi:hypothetical protein
VSSEEYGIASHEQTKANKPKSGREFSSQRYHGPFFVPSSNVSFPPFCPLMDKVFCEFNLAPNIPKPNSQSQRSQKTSLFIISSHQYQCQCECIPKFVVWWRWLSFVISFFSPSSRFDRGRGGRGGGKVTPFDFSVLSSITNFRSTTSRSQQHTMYIQKNKRFTAFEQMCGF